MVKLRSQARKGRANTELLLLLSDLLNIESNRLNIIKGEGYEKLCPFLGKPIKRKNIPHIRK